MSSASSDPAESALAHAAVAELDDEFTRMRHIVVRDEKKTYQSLTNAEAKRRFILSLWETHKPAEYPNGLDYRRLYLARAREADARFTTVLRPGWNSDQGRVYILYGVPSNIEREPSNPTLKPHEIWRYDEIQGGVIFVFADRTGFRNYELIHSSHRNELQNPDWQRLITFEADTQGLQ
jgi:GWxTD domain-containing protein